MPTAVYSNTRGRKCKGGIYSECCKGVYLRSKAASLVKLESRLTLNQEVLVRIQQLAFTNLKCRATPAGGVALAKGAVGASLRRGNPLRSIPYTILIT